jgi:hypothetical protein
MSNKIAGNAQEDFQRFLHDSRAVRDDLVNVGVREGWLFDNRFFRGWGEEYYHGELMPRPDFNNRTNEIELPVFRAYSQPQFTFGELFIRVYLYMFLFVLCIIVLWLFSWQRFMKYDVR